MKRIIYFLLFSLFFFYSCTNKENSRKAINLNKQEEVSILDLFHSVEIIPLETSDQSLISIISKVLYHKDRYYVLDSKMQTIFCFNASGKFLFKISAQGQGPNEYSFIGDITIDPYNGTLLALVPFGELLAYNLDGTFISKKQLPKEINAYNEVYPLNKEELIFISLSESQILYYSRKDNSISKKKYKNEKMRKSSIFSPLKSTYIYNDSVFFLPSLSNDIINLSDNQSHFSWNFGNDNNSKDMIKDLEEAISLEKEFVKRDFVGEGKINYNIVYSYESNLYKICLLDCGKYKFKHIFINKKTGEYWIFDKTIENIRFILPDFSDENIILYDRGLPKDIPIDMTYYSTKVLSKEDESILGNYNQERDNPFLVVYSLKNNAQ